MTKLEEFGEASGEFKKVLTNYVVCITAFLGEPEAEQVLEATDEFMSKLCAITHEKFATRQ